MLELTAIAELNSDLAAAYQVTASDPREDPDVVAISQEPAVWRRSRASVFAAEAERADRREARAEARLPHAFAGLTPPVLRLADRKVRT